MYIERERIVYNSMCVCLNMCIHLDFKNAGTRVKAKKRRPL